MANRDNIERSYQSKSAVNNNVHKKTTSSTKQHDNSAEAIQMRQFQANIENNNENVQRMAYDQAVHQNESLQLQEDKQASSKNKTGLPDPLKTGMENLSGMSMDDVRVHRNSDKPAELQAHAYAQGNQIHLGPGQEEHLPHELGHVVQQKQGRVHPTLQKKGQIPINDNKGLEKEADVLGSKALQTSNNEPTVQKMNKTANQPVVQRHLFSFLGLGKQKEPEFVPESDTTAFTEKKGEKIIKSMTDAYQMVQNASSKVDKTDKRYQKYMDAGTEDTANIDKRVQHVKSGFDKVQKCLEEDTVTFKEYAINDGEEDSTYAYVIPSNQDKTIYLGGAYWDAKGKGYDSKAGTVIHELTHELHATDDHEYGREESKRLAKEDPKKATTNADNYEHFAEKA